MSLYQVATTNRPSGSGNPTESRNMPKQINKTASRVLDKLTEGLEVGESRKIDNAGPAIMAAVVECIGENLFSVAHYYEQNGDLVADPDMVFWKSPVGCWLPVSFEMPALGVYQVALWFDGHPKPQRIDPRLVSEHAVFANDWMKNIRDQQGLTI